PIGAGGRRGDAGAPAAGARARRSRPQRERRARRRAGGGARRAGARGRPLTGLGWGGSLQCASRRRATVRSAPINELDVAQPTLVEREECRELTAAAA